MSETPPDWTLFCIVVAGAALTLVACILLSIDY